MTISISTPTSNTGSIQNNSTDVLTIGSDNSVSIDTNTLHIDATNNRVGIGTTTPSRELHVVAGNDNLVRIQGGVSNAKGIEMYDGSTVQAQIYSASSDLRFFANSTERMRIDSSGRVTMPSQPHIMGTPTNTTGAGLANSFATTTSQGGLTFANSRITVPVTGIYLITFNTICDNTSGRVDAKVWINGGEKFNTLSEDNGQGHHYRGVSNAILLQANDYIQFDNNDWYDGSNTGATQWRTASVTLIG